MNDQQRNELFTYIHVNQKARSRSHLTSNKIWDAGFYAGYLAAMEDVLNIFDLKEEFQKWSDDHAESKNSPPH